MVEVEVKVNNMEYRKLIRLILLVIGMATLIFLLVIEQNEYDQSKIMQVHIIAGPGRMTPSWIPKNDPNSESTYIDGLNMISRNGKFLIYENGEKIYDRFIERLGINDLEEFQNDFSISMVNDQNNFNTARLIINGLNLNILSYLKNIVSNNKNLMLEPNVHCQRLIKYFDDIRNSNEWINKSIEFEDFFKNLSNMSGDEFDIENGAKYFKTLLIERESGRSWPKWITIDEFQMLKLVSKFEIKSKYFSNNVFIQKLQCGMLLDKILHDFKQTISNQDTKKFNLYSVKDDTIWCLMNVLNKKYENYVEPNTYVAFELYKTNIEYRVTISVQRNSGGSIILNNPERDMDISLEKLEEQLANVVSRNITSLCNIE